MITEIASILVGEFILVVKIRRVMKINIFIPLRFECRKVSNIITKSPRESLYE